MLLQIITLVKLIPHHIKCACVINLIIIILKFKISCSSDEEENIVSLRLKKRDLCFMQTIH